MFTRIRNMHPITGIVIGVVATLVLSGTAIAVTDTNFTYSTTKVGYLTISAMELVPMNETDDYDILLLDNSLLALTPGCFSTGVNLPDRAKITTVTTWQWHEPGAVARPVYLVRKTLGTIETHRLVNQTPPVTPSEQVTVATATVPLDRRTVFNSTYSYSYTVCLGANSYFENARITYTYTSAGD